jgi:hypothetical protein
VTDADESVLPDRVLAQQVDVLLESAGQLVEQVAACLRERGRDVLEHAADGEVARVHAVAGAHLEQVADRVALAERVEERGHRAHLERARAEPDEVRPDPVELHEQHAQPLGAARDLHLQHPLHARHVGVPAEVERQVVHAIEVRDRLEPGLLLDVLLDAGVDVADLRHAAGDFLAVEHQVQAQHAVRRRVVRADVQRHELLADLRVHRWVQLARDRRRDS